MALLMLTFAAQAAEPPVRQRLQASKIPWQRLSAESHATPPPLPEQVVFEISGPARIVDQNRVLLRGLLTNPLDRNQLLLTFGGNEINAFSLRPIDDGNFRWSRQYPALPPAPAIATQRMIPPASEVAYEAMFDLGRLEYQGQPTVRFEWNFGFYRQREALKGIISLELPARGPLPAGD